MCIWGDLLAFLISLFQNWKLDKPAESGWELGRPQACAHCLLDNLLCGEGGGVPNDKTLLNFLYYIIQGIFNYWQGHTFR